MHNVKIHFYKGTHIFSKIIQWRTYSQFSHCAIEIDGFIYEAKEFHGVIKRKKRVNPPKSLVATKEYNIHPERLKNAQDWLESKLGLGYDFIGLLAFFGVPKKRQGNKKFWCSEYLEPATYLLGLTPKTDFPVSPGSLFLLCK